MSRHTPETDAVASIEGNWDTKALRMTAHSRKLEQERDDYKWQLHIAKGARKMEAAKLITMDESLYAAKCIEVYATITPEGIEDLWPPEIQRIIHEMHEVGERLNGNDSQNQ